MLGEVLTAIVTPFRADGSVDLTRSGACARTSSTTAPTASSSRARPARRRRSPTDEELALFAAAVETVGDRATSSRAPARNDTAHSVAPDGRGHELGVDGFLVVTPYYNKPPPRGIVAHFAAIAEATDRPIVVYNIPQRVVVNIEPETLAELAEIPNVTAVKQATTDPEPGTADRRDRSRRSTPGTTTSCSRSSSWAAPAGSSSTPMSSGRRCGSWSRASRTATSTARTRSTPSSRPVIEALAVTTNPIPVKAALDLARPRRRRPAPAARRGDGRREGRHPRGLERAGVLWRSVRSRELGPLLTGRPGRGRQGSATRASGVGRPDAIRPLRH